MIPSFSFCTISYCKVLCNNIIFLCFPKIFNKYFLVDIPNTNICKFSPLFFHVHYLFHSLHFVSTQITQIFSKSNHIKLITFKARIYLHELYIILPIQMFVLHLRNFVLSFFFWFKTFCMQLKFKLFMKCHFFILHFRSCKFRTYHSSIKRNCNSKKNITNSRYMCKYRIQAFYHATFHVSIFFQSNICFVFFDFV